MPVSQTKIQKIQLIKLEYINLLFLFMFLYMSMLGSSYIIIVSGMGDVVPILSAVVIVFTVVFDGRRVMR